MLCNLAFPLLLEIQEKYRTLNRSLIAHLEDSQAFHVIVLCILTLQRIGICRVLVFIIYFQCFNASVNAILCSSPCLYLIVFLEEMSKVENHLNNKYGSYG